MRGTPQMIVAPDIFKLVCSIVAFALISRVGCVSDAYAQGDPDSPVERQKLEIARSLCGKDGKLAECIGYSAGSCPELMKPLVDTCSSTPAVGEPLNEDTFQRCFWREFSRRYGKSIDRSERCFKTDPNASPLQPIPPDMEGKYKLLNTPKPTP
jgi:hypothetical protein